MTERVLMVHNYYGSSAPSGENVMVDAERKLLHDHGVHVELYARRSDQIRDQGIWGGAIKTAPVIPWNIKSYRYIQRQLCTKQFDVMHVHNAFPMVSPSVFYAARGCAARVLTLHNYRLYCSAGIPLRDGKTCTECIDHKSSFPALKYGCYRNSRLATLPLAISVALHRWLGTWQTEVDAFIALSDFQRELMVKSGLPAHKVYVKSNFVAAAKQTVPWDEREPYIVYVGRLGPEKGLRSLVIAWQKWGREAPELRIVGDGPIRAELEAAAAGLPITFTGQLSPTEVQKQQANACLLVLPSECLETSSLVIMEAFAQGTPVAASAIGPLPDLVGDGGVTFPPTDPDSLLRVVRLLWDNDAKLARLSAAAKNASKVKYSALENAKILLSIYEAAQINSRQRCSSA